MMGRVGRGYPRFDEAPKSSILPTQEEGIFAAQVAGAVVGILAALGLIGWLMLIR
jgi:hypothetical protein